LTNKQIADVSIIVPNYNNGRYLEAFIGSVVNSTIEPRELIIVNDGSEDDSLKILAGFKHLPFLKVISFEKNKGLTTALNTGLEMSLGKYVMRADPDDRLAPDRMEKQYQFMENNPDIDVLGCNVIYFNHQTGKEINISNFPKTHKNIERAFKNGDHGLQHPTVFAKGEVYRKYRYQEIFPGEDYELFSRMVKDGYRFANLREPLYYMRVHAGSSTSNLTYNQIQTTFRFRDKIFGTKTSEWKIWSYYQHMLNYRKFQHAHSALSKSYYLLLAGLFYLSKVMKRITK